MPRGSGSTNHVPSSFMGTLLSFGGLLLQNDFVGEFQGSGAILELSLEKPGKQFRENNGKAEIWEQLHSCPSSHQFLGTQKLRGEDPSGSLSQKKNKAPGWAQEKQIPRERPAPGWLPLGTWLWAPLANLGYQRPVSLRNGTKDGALMINSAKSCGFFIPKAPGSSSPM